LVPAKGRWCSAAGEVTAGLAESNGSLPPGGWLNGHLQADSLYTGISSGPNAQCRVCEAFTFFTLSTRGNISATVQIRCYARTTNRKSHVAYRPVRDLDLPLRSFTCYKPFQMGFCVQLCISVDEIVNWFIASRGLSATVELLVHIRLALHVLLL